ncbi:MAG: Flp pilus assembly protein CpaB [Pirellulales bacterium]|nr:Flp pilus assembly protein CpaB [Pirellulales bacterium]
MKRISPGTVTVGVLAVLFGLVAAYAARHLTAEGPAQVIPPEKPRLASVLVPRVNLPKYSRLRDQDIEVRQVPPDQVPVGAVRLKSRALFRVVRSTMLAGEPIMEADLFPVGEVPKLADQLPSGYRAVTVQVDADSALNGMIQPESLVDIALTVKGDHPDVSGLATLTILRHIKVLATSEARYPRSQEHASKLRNITVAVTPQDANKIILAQRYGTLSVTLRSSIDEGTGKLVSMSDDRDLVNPNDLLGLAPTIDPIPIKVEKRAQIWRGGKVEELTFREPLVNEAINTTAAAEGRPIPAPTNYSSPGAPEEPECKDCDKKNKSKTAVDATSPQPTPAFPTAVRLRPQGNVISVDIEAHQTGTNEMH